MLRARVVEHPDDAVPVELLERGGREVQCDERRVRPVEQSRGKAVVLGEREPVPGRVGRDRFELGVTPEAPKQRRLDRPHVAAEPDQARPQILSRVVPPAEREARPEAAEALLPRIREQLLL